VGAGVLAVPSRLDEREIGASRAKAYRRHSRPSGSRRHALWARAELEQDYDAIVIGSGITGGLAAKELTESGLRTLVQARADAARLSGALTRIDTPDADHVQVAFGAVSFADWLGWIAALQTQHVRLEAARIEALSAPGMVSASATLTRAGAQ